MFSILLHVFCRCDELSFLPLRNIEICKTMILPPKNVPRLWCFGGSALPTGISFQTHFFPVGLPLQIYSILSNLLVLIRYKVEYNCW